VFAPKANNIFAVVRKSSRKNKRNYYPNHSLRCVDKFVLKRALINIIDIATSKIKIFNLLNKFLHEAMFPHPFIIPCGTISCVSPLYNFATHSRMKQRMINYI
jgi:hypothetical protein